MIRRDRLMVVGHPVKQSLSPIMHNAALDALGIDTRYSAVDVQPAMLEDFLRAASSTRCGGNFTIPHKRAAMSSMARVSDIARMAGSVNTFWSDGDGVLHGDNTDVAGFEAAIVDLCGEIPTGVNVAVVGAGGSAAAVLTAVQRWPSATACVHGRSPEKLESIRSRFSVVTRTAAVSDRSLSRADIVVNATPIGMVTRELPFPVEYLRPDAAVLDLVYGENETLLVQRARAAGHLAADGLRMLLHQGVAAFSRWYDVQPDASVMWNALLTATGRQM
ncbi:MAG: shikimate dehydrogenase [Gemmatimonadaceae bacterium]